MSTLTKYERELAEQGYSLRTIRAKVGAVRAAATSADVEPEDLTRDDVLEWLGSRERADWTRIKYLSHLSAWCAWRGVPDVTEGLRRPRQPAGIPRPVTESGLEAMLDVARDRERAFLVLGAFCGLRSFETAKVAGRDIERAADGTSLLRIVGKGGQVGLVPMPPVVIEELAPWVERAGSGALWPGTTSNAVQQVIRGVAERAGVICTSHMLRHRYGTAVYAVDRDLLRTQRLMRHRSPATTAGYALVADNSLGRLVEQLPGARGRVDPDADGRHLRIVR